MQLLKMNYCDVSSFLEMSCYKMHIFSSYLQYLNAMWKRTAVNAMAALYLKTLTQRSNSAWSEE